MPKVFSVLLTGLMGVFILISEINFYPDYMGKYHHGNCNDGMMEGELTAKTEIHNKIEFRKEKTVLSYKLLEIMLFQVKMN